MEKREARRRLADARPAKERTSGRHVPQSWRAPQQYAAAFAGNDRAIFGYGRKSKRDEMIDGRSNQAATFRCGPTKRL
jgi:hypothetical protein